ncbi:MAG: DegT/DnrJ/EryC1/StrS family aminotransferase [Candidatus Bathyarchaeota archaeon]|nr:DegT/DnrJ/EryC1/StrS family aminotransferase [Candidatus Bathyarchaeota archaeon]
MAKLAIAGGEPVRRKPFPKWPIFDEREAKALLDVLNSGLWGIGGSKKREFEERFAKYQHAKYGVAVTSGTTALEISLKSLGIGCGDEVIVPSYTFMATAISVLYVNAIPVFADIDPETYNIDPKSVEQLISDRTKAILPVHIGGRPADMDALPSIAGKNELYIVEDACQAWGAEWRGRRVGAIGDIGSFSFQSSKNITSGEGGIIVTNNEELYIKAWSLHNCGRLPGKAWYEHYLPGANYRMTEFQAAILLAQMERFDRQTERRIENAQYLNNKLSKIDGVKPLKNDERITRHAYHLYIFRIEPEAFGGVSKATIAKALQAEGIPASVGYSKPLYKEPYIEYFRRCPLSCPYYGRQIDYSIVKAPVAERACYYEGLWLPQYVLLGSREDMDDIVAAFEKIKYNLEELYSYRETQDNY